MKIPLVAIALAGAFSGSAMAADPQFDAFMGRVVGNQTTVTFGGNGTPMLTSSSHLGNAPAVGNMRVFSDTAGGVRFQGRADVVIPGTAKTAPVDVKVPLTKANFGKALMVAGKIAWPIGVALQAGDIFNYLTGLELMSIRNTGDEITAQAWEKYVFNGREFAYQSGGPWFRSAMQACQAGASFWFPPSPNIRNAQVTHITGEFPVMCEFSLETAIRPGEPEYGYKPATTQKATLSRVNQGVEVGLRDVRQPEIEDMIAQESGWPTSTTRALAEALNVPGVGPRILTETPNIVGPFAVSGEKTSATESVRLIPGTTTIAPPGTANTEPGTKTTTTQAQQKLSYKDNVMTATSVTNNTTTNITNNITNQTINEGDVQTETEMPEIQVCGLPGTPACKIDEAGTPEAKEDTAEQDAKKAIKPLDDFIANPQSVLPEFPKINWAFTLPSGCAPIALPAFEPWLQQIDVCAFQPIFHDIMSFVWIMGGIFGAIGTFWRNTFSQG